MFALLRGPWPRTTADGISAASVEADVAAGRATAADLDALLERLVAEAIGAQVAAGMGIVTDGQVRSADAVEAWIGARSRSDIGADGMLLRAWSAAAALADVPVAATVPGPWTLAMREVGAWSDVNVISAQALDHAVTLASELALLAGAGCPMVVVEEPAATGIGENAKARDGFVRAHKRLLRDAPELHAMLAVTGGSANLTGPEAIFGAPYRSHLFDLIEGPDNWYLVRQAPAERGIVCAALVAVAGQPVVDQAPMLVWAAQYAASSNGRGLDRIGLANASSMASLAPGEATVALEALARATAFAAMPPADAIAAGLDPRAFEVIPGTFGS